jgi:hypothetical protein
MPNAPVRELVVKRHWPSAVAVAGFLTLFVLLHWNSFLSPLERDEGEYAYSAMIMRQGGMPYEDSFLQKPPMIVYTYALAQALAPRSLWAPRALAALFTAATIVLLGFVAAREYDYGTGEIAVSLALPMLMYPRLMPFAANTEKFMLLPLFAALAVRVQVRARARGHHLMAAGALTAAAILYKPICLFVCAWLLTEWAAEVGAQHDALAARARAALMAAGWLVLGGGLAAALILLPFLLRDGGRAMLQTAFTYNLQYVKDYGFGSRNLSMHLKNFVLDWWPLVLLLCHYLAARPKRRWFWAGSALAALLAIYPSPIGHYYLLLVPFWAVMAAWAMSDISRRLTSTHQAQAVATLLAVVLAVILAPFAKQFLMTPEALNRWVYGTINPFLEARIAGEQVRRSTEPTDYILVAGSEPEICFYAQRRNATRFDIVYPLDLPSPQALGYQRQAIAQLRRHPPAAIVLSRMDSSWGIQRDTPPEFLRFLGTLLEGYSLQGGVMQTDNGAYFAPSSDRDRLRDAVLLIYQKKKVL